METLNTPIQLNAVDNDNQLIEQTVKKLKRLKLSKSWAAKQMEITPEYLGKILGKKKDLTTPMKGRLSTFILKLESFEPSFNS